MEVVTTNHMHLGARMEIEKIRQDAAFFFFFFQYFSYLRNNHIFCLNPHSFCVHPQQFQLDHSG